MKSGSSMWVRNPLFYHLYQRPMIEFSANKLAGTGTLHSAVEWHCYLHLFLPPPSIHIQPFLTSLVIWTTASERGENLAPFCRANIIWIERRITNNVDEIFELRLRFLNTAIPVPASQKERVSVRKRPPFRA
jgi:hypothetical protein